MHPNFYFFNLLYFFIIYSITVVPIFFPFAPLHSAQPPHTQSIPLPLLVSRSHSECSLTNPFSFLLPSPRSFLPSYSFESVPCFRVSGSIFFLLLYEVIWCLYFADWLISLSIIVSSSVHAVTKGRSSFFLLHSIPLCKCTIVFWFTHLLMATWAASNTWLL